MLVGAELSNTASHTKNERLAPRIQDIACNRVLACKVSGSGKVAGSDTKILCKSVTFLPPA